MKRKLLSLLFAGLLCFGITAGILYERAVEAYNPNNLIRLHIVPNSDSPVDQELKHRVRRAVVEAMAPKFKKIDNVSQARRLVDTNLEQIKSVAAKEVALAGKDYGVCVYHGRFDFPDRKYGDLMLPAGEYEAVRLVLGSGKGQNWWCVLFPPLCMVNIEVSEEVPALAGTSDEGRVRFKSRLWELAGRRFSQPPKQVVRSSKADAD